MKKLILLSSIFFINTSMLSHAKTKETSNITSAVVSNIDCNLLSESIYGLLMSQGFPHHMAIGVSIDVFNQCANGELQPVPAPW